jgi:hypothetical protein
VQSSAKAKEEHVVQAALILAGEEDVVGEEENVAEEEEVAVETKDAKLDDVTREMYAIIFPCMYGKQDV